MQLLNEVPVLNPDSLHHFLFSRRKDFFSNFRVLIAGEFLNIFSSALLNTMFCRVNTSAELHFMQRISLRNHVCRVNPCAEYVLFKVNTSAESCYAKLIFFPPRNYTLCSVNFSAVSLRNPMMCPQ